MFFWITHNLNVLQYDITEMIENPVSVSRYCFLLCTGETRCETKEAGFCMSIIVHSRSRGIKV